MARNIYSFIKKEKLQTNRDIYSSALGNATFNRKAVLTNAKLRL